MPKQAPKAARQLDAFYTALLLVAKQLQKEVPEVSSAEFMLLDEVSPGVYGVPAYMPIWETLKQLHRMLPLVKLAHKWKPDEIFAGVIESAEAFTPLDARGVIDPASDDDDDDVTSDDGAGPLPALEDKRETND